MTTPEQQPSAFLPPDRLDQETDKLGSAALARNRLYGELPQEYLPVRAPRPDKLPMSSARRRMIAGLAKGAQIGDDALDVVDQSRSAEGNVALRKQSYPVVENLFEENIQRARQRAIDKGMNPDAIEQGMRARRRAEKN